MRRSLGAGIIAACVVVAAYQRGAARAFGYDASVTVAHFVRTSSLLDPFRRHVTYNNHVAFSFVEHLVYTATGSASEATMRVLPIVSGAACVGVLVGVLAARTGLWIALTAGALLATNPVFVAVSTDVRGYSLLCLCGVVSTVAMLSLLRSESSWGSALYVGVVALGLATHLYMLFIVAGQVVFVVTRRKMSARWALWWLAGGLLGAGAYVAVASAMLATNQHGAFQPGFPRVMISDLLGAAPAAVLLTGAGAAITLWNLRKRPETRALGVLFGGIVLALWLVVTPPLYSRYFVWAVPAVAVAAAIGLSRVGHRKFVTAGVALACLFAFAQSPVVNSSDEIANRAAVSFIAAARSRGETVCGLGTSTEALAAYARRIPAVYSRSEFQGCDLLVALDPVADTQLVTQAEAVFAHRRKLDARTPGLVWWN